MNDLSLQVMTNNIHLPVNGSDSMVTHCPQDMVPRYEGKVIISTPLVKLVTDMSYTGAERLGAILHHADWVVTVDPAVVKARGLQHDCPSCRAGLDQALAHLRENPTKELLVGVLYWAEVPT